MRIAVLVIGLILTIFLFVQSALVTGLSNASGHKETQQSGSFGILMAVIWIVACGLVIPVPRVSMILFAVAALFGFVFSGQFSDLKIWAVVSLVLALFSYFGYRGKRKADAKEAERDAMFRTMASTQATKAQDPSPPSSHSANSY